MRKFIFISLLLFGLSASTIFPGSSSNKKPVSMLTVCVDASWIFDSEWVEEAKWIERSLLSTARKMYDISTWQLYSKTATKANFLNRLSWAARAESLSIVYLGSHGADSNGYHCYLADGTLSGYEIKRVLQSVKCNIIFLVDTCHAGALARELEGLNNVIVLAACSAAQSARPMVFSPPFVDSLTKGDKNNNGYVDIEEICDYVSNNMVGQTFTRSSSKIDVNLSKIS